MPLPLYHLKCPKCGKCDVHSVNKVFFCENCGTEMIEESWSKKLNEESQEEVKEDYPEIDSSKHQAKEEIINESQEETMNLPLPKDLKLKEIQNPECQKKGNVCATRGIHDVCLTPLPPVEDSDGNVPLFDIKPCSKSPKQELDFSEDAE